MKTIEIKTKNPDSRYAALDFNNEVICEGTDPNSVIDEAREKVGNEFIFTFVPDPNADYIFTPFTLTKGDD